MSNFPRGWHPGLIEKRYADSTASSYSKADGTIECVISRGSPVQRFYGTEILRITPEAVDLNRLTSSGIPVLDSHQGVGIKNALGKVTRVWFDGGALKGKIAFNKTTEGKQAEGMAARGEIAGISAGYAVQKWKITDADNREIDPEKDHVRWDDALTFEATRWELHEISMVSCPADASASMRSLEYNSSNADEIENIRARMMARHRMHQRESMMAAQQALFGASE
jgi:phage head maturation protease